MENKVLKGGAVVVTGASMGLGKAVARACLQAGASVFLCAREANALERARAGLASEFGTSRVHAMTADVADEASVEKLFLAASRELPNVTGVVNNAGVVGPLGPAESVDWKEWVRTIEINLLGTVLCSRAVVPIFKKAGGGKIVNLSGGGATAPMPRFSAYAASKAAVVRFTETLAVELAPQNIAVNAVAPGALNTRILEQVLAAGPGAAGSDYYDRSVRQKQQGGASPERAAELCVFLLSPQSDGITGRLISAVWDPWEKLASHRRELAASDVYTLRRIVPKDRGWNWDGQ